MLNVDKYKVKIEDLNCKNVLDKIDFKTTEEITPIREIIGQNRAVQAIEFGLKMKQKNSGLEILRIIAMFFIVLSHSCFHGEYMELEVSNITYVYPDDNFEICGLEFQVFSAYDENEIELIEQR